MGWPGRFQELSLKCKQKGAPDPSGTIHCGKFTTEAPRKRQIFLRQALGAAEAEKWEYFWDWQPETVYTMCRHALLKNIHPKWAAYLLRRWFPQRTGQEAGSLLVYPDENVRNCTEALLRDLVRQTETPLIHVNCLGDFRVFVNGVEINPSSWKTKKVESLFKFLVIERRQHLKEKIIEEFWPDAEPRLGDVSLRMALTNIRKALGLTGECLVLKRGLISLNPEIKIYTDYELFTSTAQQAIQDGDLDNPTCLDLLGQSAGLYRGEFLPDDIYDDWTASLRAQLHKLYLQVLSKKVEILRRQSRLIPAIEVCRLYLSLEPTDEPVCRTAMELLWQTGQKQQALSVYKELTANIAKEFNSSPSSETITLYEKIK